jgi:hypothetical protein
MIVWKRPFFVTNYVGRVGFEAVHATCFMLLALFFDTVDGGDIFLQNVG